MINPDVLGNLRRIKDLVSNIPAGPNETFVNTTIGGGFSGSTAEDPCGTGVRPGYEFTPSRGPVSLECLAAFQFYWNTLLGNGQLLGLGTSINNLCGHPTLNGTISDADSCIIVRGSNEPGLQLMDPSVSGPYVWPLEWTPYQRGYSRRMILFRKPRGIPSFLEGCGQILGMPIIFVLDICGIDVTPPPPTVIPPDKYVQHPWSLPPYLYWNNPDGRALKIPIWPLFPFDSQSWRWPNGVGGNPVGPPLPGTPAEQLGIIEDIVECIQNFYDSVNEQFPGGGPYNWDMTDPCCAPGNLTRMRLLKELFWCLQRIRYGPNNCPLWTPSFPGLTTWPGCEFELDGPSNPGRMNERLTECIDAIRAKCASNPNPNNP